jgi:hypothetical protein
MPGNDLIYWGCDLQQKLEAMDRSLRRARWAGYVGEKLYRIARRLNDSDQRSRTGRGASGIERTEQRLLDEARIVVQELGHGIEVYRQPYPNGWPIVIVFPGDVPAGSGPEAFLEQGIAVPPKP